MLSISIFPMYLSLSIWRVENRSIMSPLDYLDPMQSGLPITLLWLGSVGFFMYALFGGKK